MRLVIDLQGAQSASSRRGIGRYTLAFAQAIARNAQEHDVLIALNGAFQDSIEPIRAKFNNLVPQECIRVWQPPLPVAAMEASNSWRAQAAEHIRESFLCSLKPDVVHVSSLFEGWIDHVVTSIGLSRDAPPTSVTLYDLVPLSHPDHYLKQASNASWYHNKIENLRQASAWLAISESSRREGIDYLGLPADKVFNVSAAADACFRPLSVIDAEAVRRRYGISRPFVMHAGAFEYRKNFEGLIAAYARLPVAVRRTCQLVIVCTVSDGEARHLQQVAKRRGLVADELVLTGFVPEADLIALYNLCAVFCFPSLHEGFGLPALEAMLCGAPTIGANTSSIPEVIGDADALFDPSDSGDMAARLHRALTDEDYRQTLRRRGLRQARKFSWDECARRAWKAFKALHQERIAARRSTVSIPHKRPRLAYVSPLPPARSGISDYSVELLPSLARHYDIDVIVDQPEISSSWITENCDIRDVSWFNANHERYGRVLYHFGNSDFHKHMFAMLRRRPGVVVLHDFFLSGLVASMQMNYGIAGFFDNALYRSHGFAALRERWFADDLSQVSRKSPANLEVLAGATGIIVHSRHSCELADRFCGAGFSRDWTVVPMLKRVGHCGSRNDIRKALGFQESDFVVCSFGMMEETKLNDRLLDAWIASSLTDDPACHLVFVGQENERPWGADVRRVWSSAQGRDRIHFTGFVERMQFERYLCSADAAVQLRKLSRGETSKAVFDCAAHGLPTIVNAHGSLVELPRDCVVMLPDQFSDGELVSALEALRCDPVRRATLSESARSHVELNLSPSKIAGRYRDAIETFHAASRGARIEEALTAVGHLDGGPSDRRQWLAVARSFARTFPRPGPRQLLVDISMLVDRDLKTGIERVTRSLLLQLLENPPLGFRVEPVYSRPGGDGYRYARSFTLRFLDCPANHMEDAPIEYHSGDVFLGLELAHAAVSSHGEEFADMRRIGVGIHFIVYDLLPMTLPQHFFPYVREAHEAWLSTVASHADALICISRAAAADLATWLASRPVPRARPLRIDWIHLGADLDPRVSSRGLPDEASDVLAKIRARPTFLMVGTVEPRKGHAQALAVFEHLWGLGEDINLVIVGKHGWKVEALAESMRAHREFDRRLFWLEGIADEYLEKVYTESACLIAASEGEGFGLPLVEAARHKIPIVARDIPVFREIAGEYATYFSRTDENGLQHALEEWLALFRASRHQRSDDMPWITWAQSSERLKTIILDGACDRRTVRAMAAAG